MSARSLGTIWVCIDCYLAHNGFLEALESETDRERSTDREPLNLIPEGYDVTAGLLDSEHADDCPIRTRGDELRAVGFDCDCAHQSFSWSACEGCGSTLGGTRDALTLWEVQP